MNLWKIPKISISPELIIGGWITNTLICTWITIIVLAIVFYFGTRRRALVPSGLQNGLEWVVEFLLGLVESVSGKEKGRKFFPLVASFFFFILFANLLDIIPGVDTIGTPDTDPTTGLPSLHGVGIATFGPITFLTGAASNMLVTWIRPATTDLNLTIAMAVISVVTTQIFSFQLLGAGKQISKYLNFKALARGPLGAVDFFVGILEIISEVGRIISFSFRLFGNIFAGSVLLAVFAFLLPVVANVIFVPFELFVAAIQAFVFSFLTLLFMELGSNSHDHEAEAEYEDEHTGNTAVAAH